MLRALDPVIYWLAFFSIVFHGLSIPALNAFYLYKGVEPIVEDDAVEITMRSENEPLPSNAYVNPKRGSVVVSNRFSRPNLQRDIQFSLPISKYTSSVLSSKILTLVSARKGIRHVLKHARRYLIDCALPYTLAVQSVSSKGHVQGKQQGSQKSLPPHHVRYEFAFASLGLYDHHYRSEIEMNPQMPQNSMPAPGST